jgi:transcriptional regulator with XRE-family HTH domain
MDSEQLQRTQARFRAQREASGRDHGPVGDRLREIREHQGLSQGALGAKLGLAGQVAYTTISRYELGEKTPSIGRLLELAEALGVEPGDLFAPVASLASAG